MKSQVLHTVWCNIPGEAAGEIRTWSLFGVKGLMAIIDITTGVRFWKISSWALPHLLYIYFHGQYRQQLLLLVTVGGWLKKAWKHSVKTAIFVWKSGCRRHCGSEEWFLCTTATVPREKKAVVALISSENAPFRTKTKLISLAPARVGLPNLGYFAFTVSVISFLDLASAAICARFYFQIGNWSIFTEVSFSSSFAGAYILKNELLCTQTMCECLVTLQIR